jgi:hypothetical protein
MAPSVSLAVTLDRGHQILLQKGFQIQALVASTPYGFSDARWRASNFTSPLLVGGIGSAEPPTSGGQWGRWINGTGDEAVRAGEDASKLVNLQWRDEQSLTSANISEAASKFTTWKSAYPNAMVYTNQWGTQETTGTLGSYIDTAHPDMLSFDTYPFNGSLTGGSPKTFYQDLQKYRRLSLGWRDGDATAPSRPILPYSVYLQTVVTNNHTVSESEVRLNQFGAWTFGAKMATAFYYIDSTALPGLHSVLFEANSDAAPTTTFNHVAETNRQSCNLGPALVRLGSTNVLMAMGRHKYDKVWPWDPDSVTNAKPSGVSTWSTLAVPYITSISATNLGGTNDGLSGDVVIGAFKPLDASLTNAGHENDTYFMITNGLTDANGSAADCQQQVQLTFDFGTSGINSLQRLSRETGMVEVLNLTQISGSQYSLAFTLDGGTGDLFKFNNGGVFVVPEPNSALLLGMAGLCVGGIMMRRRWRLRVRGKAR